MMGTEVRGQRTESSTTCNALSVGIACVSAAFVTLVCITYKVSKDNERLRQRLRLDNTEGYDELRLAEDSTTTGEKKTFTATAASTTTSTSRPCPVVLHPIGTILSPFPQRAGTPRQGLLARHARSNLIFESDVPFEVLKGIEDYSHVWVLFQFHLNPVPKGKDVKARSGTKRRNNKDDEGRCSACGLNLKKSSYPTKIRPPRAKGVKVGCLATRSPHRPNAVGLSLALVETITYQSYVDRATGKNRRRVVLSLLGLDLVDGTPVFDVKPYVPWDNVWIPGNDSVELNGENGIRVPSWVSQDDKLSEVRWSETARKAILEARECGHLSPLYPPIEGGKRQIEKKREAATHENGKIDLGLRRDESDEIIIHAIHEIISQDPRAIHEGRGQGTATSDNDSSYEITFCSLRIRFRVVSPSIVADGTSADSYAEVLSAVKDEGDESAVFGSYQHNLFLRQKAEKNAAEVDEVLKWAGPVREGVTDSLFDLEGGGTWCGIKDHV